MSETASDTVRQPDSYIPPAYSGEAEIIPDPKLEAQELIDAIAAASRGEGTKTPIRSFGSTEIYKGSSATVVETGTATINGKPYKVNTSISRASINPNGSVQHAFLDLSTYPIGSKHQDEIVLSQNPRTGGFDEYTTRKKGPFSNPEVRKNGPMSERRIRAAAKLVRIKHGIPKPQHMEQE